MFTNLPVTVLLLLAVAAAPTQQPPAGAAQNEPAETKREKKPKLTAEQRKLISTQAEATDDPAEQARMRRMADNLLKPQLKLTPEAAAAQRAAWVKHFRDEKNPLLRMEVVTEMVQLDDPATLGTMLNLLPNESHPGVRDQIVLIVGYLSATTKDMPKAAAELTKAYEKGSAFERARILEIVSNLPTPESVAFMKAAFTDPKASADDRFHAAEGLFKLAPRTKVDPALIAQFTDRLKQDARLSDSARERGLAITALAAPGQDNKAYLRKLIADEKDPKLRTFLKRASEQYPQN